MPQHKHGHGHGHGHHVHAPSTISLSSSSSSSSSSSRPFVLSVLPCVSPTQFRRFRRTVYFKLLILVPVAWLSFMVIVSVFGSSSPTTHHPDLLSNKLPHPEPHKHVFPEDPGDRVRKKVSPNSMNNVIESGGAGGLNGPGDVVDVAMGVLAPPGELNPGEMGKPYRLPKNLTEEQKKVVADGWKRNAFNQVSTPPTSHVTSRHVTYRCYKISTDDTGLIVL